MNNSGKFDSIWKLMSEHRFYVDPDSIHEDLECGLCNKLMIDACQTRCGCQYCYSCLRNYFGETDKHCPGKNEECKERVLVLVNDVTRDAKANNKIFKTRVFCPNSSCKLRMELGKIEGHLRLCTIESNQSSSSLTVSEFGGSNRAAFMEEVRAEIVAQMDVLINNMKNEFYDLKRNLEMSKSEIESLKEDLRIKEKQIEEIGSLKEELREKENRIDILTSHWRNTVAIMDRNAAEQERKNEDIINKIKGTELKLPYYIKWANMCPNVDYDFVWKVNNLSNPRRFGVKYDSDEFSSYEYRFRLCVSLKSDNVSLWCYIMKGDCDERLRWPMPYHVVLSILNRDTMTPFVSRAYDYGTYDVRHQSAFEQPHGVRNSKSIGQHSILTYSRIEDNPRIVDNDSIIVACKLCVVSDSDDDSSDESDDLAYLHGVGYLPG